MILKFWRMTNNSCKDNADECELLKSIAEGKVLVLPTLKMKQM